MGDFVLIDGDTAEFDAAFGAATVTVSPGTLQCSGPAMLGGNNLCVDGDEGSVSVPGCAYVTSTHTIPGTGTLTIESLNNDQVAQTVFTGGIAVMLKGSTFTANFEVTDPAKKPEPPPSPPTPDLTSSYSGTGSFQTTNSVLTAS